MTWQALTFVACVQFQLFFTAESATPSVALCPRYVDEGGTLTCTCTRGDCNNPQFTVTWPNHSPSSPTLVQTNVSRQDNGTQYTCQMLCGSETSTITYMLKVGYGPSADNLMITGPSTFVTDGTRLLNLTCVATETYPAPVYTWTDPVCRDYYKGDTCSFTPRPADYENLTVRCRASDAFRDSPVTVVKDFTIDLQYPPNKAPVILGHEPFQFVKSGDILTCKVDGGKPLVNVTFNCSDPDHEDQGDTNTEREAYSSITVNTSSVTKDKETMTCYCSGHWSPEPDLYPPETHMANATYFTQYLPELTNFTINMTDTDTLTLNESDYTRLTMQCSAYGRPAPRVSLLKNGIMEIVRNADMDEFNFTQTISYVLQSAECKDTGNYTCHAGDGSPNFDSKTFQLNVNCAPTSDASDGKKCSAAMKDSGFELLIVANPSPEFEIVKVTSPGETQDEDVDGLFIIRHSQISPYETQLQVTAKGPEGLPDGEYRLVVSNSFGKFECKFSRENGGSMSSADIGAIAGAAAAGVVLIIIIIVIIVCCKRRRIERKRKGMKMEDRQGMQNSYFEMEGREPDNGDDSGIVANGRSSPSDSDPKTDTTPLPRPSSDNAGYVNFNDFSAPVHPDGVLRKKNARAAAYDVTSVTSTGKITIKEQTTPQPNAYADPWETKKPFDASLGQGIPADYPPRSKTSGQNVPTVTDPRDVYATFAKHDKGDNAQASGEQSKGGKKCGNASGNSAPGGPPTQDMTSSKHDSHTYDHAIRRGHVPTSASQQAEAQYDHIGNLGKT